MEYIIYSLAFTSGILLLTLIEKNIEKSIITPFTVMAWPFAAISLIDNIFGVKMDLLPITGRVHIFLAVFVSVFWAVGRIVSSLFPEDLQSWGKTKIEIHKKVESYRKYEIFLILISWILGLAIIWKARNLLSQNGGLVFIADIEYEKRMTEGIINFLLNFGKVSVIFLFFLYKNSERKIMLLATFGLMAVALVFQHIKFNLIWIIFICFFYKNIFEYIRKQLKNILIISSTIFGILAFFWIVLVLAWGNFGLTDRGMWMWVSKTFMIYLCSGPINLDTWLDLGQSAPDWGILLVFKNIINIIKDNPIRYSVLEYLTPGFLQINLSGIKMDSNTGTAFGVYYLIGGLYFTLFMTILTSGISYLLYFLVKKTNEILVIFFASLFLTISTLSFFSSYFTAITFWVISVVIIIFILGFKFLNRFLFFR